MDEQQNEAKQFKRLSKGVQPTNYNIRLEPNLESFKCPGEETIDLEVKRESINRITINSVDIDIVSAKFKTEDESEIEPIKTVYKADRETVTFLFENDLPVGKGQLFISFISEINDKLKGFYRSKYTGENGQERFSAVTQFEATDARRAFPCWDEPAIKATFDITLVAPRDRVVLSNMDVEHEELHADEERKIVTFKKTPIMSTYLVAFVVGEYDFIDDTTSDGIYVRVFTPVGKREQGRFALEIAVKTLPFYSDYFGIPYPLPKLDLIAIPDFDAGAMENWGLVTYREVCLLIDEKESSVARKQRVALVVGHELAHQWFGNLTTMEWWTHLWLNEGFASWVEYLCVDYCCPSFNIWQQFVVSTLTPALQLDALANSHPIEVPVGHPSEVDEIFDAISYDKGASVIQMLYHYIGKDDFKAGMHSYLTEFAYKNASTEDLWLHLEKGSRKPVKNVMDTWTKKMGYPVLTVSSETTGTQRILKVSQKKFNADGSPSPTDMTWAIPISLTTSKEPGKVEFSTLLNEKDMVLFLDIPGDHWIKMNPGQIGFYRTLYSSEMLEALIPAISTLPAVDRLGIENDLFALAGAGETSAVDFLKLTLGYVDEMDYTVWNDLVGNIRQLALIMQSSENYKEFKTYVINLLKPALQKLGSCPIDGEDPSHTMLRSLLLETVGRSGDADVISECHHKFKKHVEGGEAIPADIRSAVYRTVATHGDEDTIEQLLTLYRNSTHQEEKMRVGTSLGLNENSQMISKILSFSLSEEVRSQDTISIMASCTSSLLGRQLTWKFTKDNWDTLFDRYSSGFSLSALIKITTKFVSKTEAEDIENFLVKEKKVTAGERTIKQSLENIELNRAWLERDGDAISGWLCSH